MKRVGDRCPQLPLRPARVRTLRNSMRQGSVKKSRQPQRKPSALRRGGGYSAGVKRCARASLKSDATLGWNAPAVYSACTQWQAVPNPVTVRVFPTCSGY